MSNTYIGKPGNESRATYKTVTGATNATPIEITTSAAHGLADGERVEIIGVLGNLAANGVWYAQVTAANKFTIYSAWTGGAPATPVPGSGAWAAGGTQVVLPIAFLNAETLPADGDNLTAASVNVPLEANADREAFLLERVGYASVRNLIERHVYTGGTVYTALTNANRVVHTGTATGATFVDPYYLANTTSTGLAPAEKSCYIEATATGAIGITAATLPGDGIAIRLVGLVMAWDGATVLATLEGVPVCLAYQAGLTTAFFPFTCQLFATPTLTQGGVVFWRTEVFCLGGGGSVDYQLVGPISLMQKAWSNNT